MSQRSRKSHEESFLSSHFILKIVLCNLWNSTLTLLPVGFWQRMFVVCVSDDCFFSLPPAFQFGCIYHQLFSSAAQNCIPLCTNTNQMSFWIWICIKMIKAINIDNININPLKIPGTTPRSRSKDKESTSQNKEEITSGQCQWTKRVLRCVLFKNVLLFCMVMSGLLTFCSKSPARSSGQTCASEPGHQTSGGKVHPPPRKDQDPSWADCHPAMMV